MTKLMTGNDEFSDIESLRAIDRNGSVGLSDERLLSGIGIQWQLSGDESEELTVARRPIPACRASPNRPVSQSQILQTGELQSSRW